jgi:hypothetical protein
MTEVDPETGKLRDAVEALNCVCTCKRCNRAKLRSDCYTGTMEVLTDLCREVRKGAEKRADQADADALTELHLRKAAEREVSDLRERGAKLAEALRTITLHDGKVADCPECEALSSFGWFFGWRR